MGIVGVDDILLYKIGLESICLQENEICSETNSQTNTRKNEMYLPARGYIIYKSTLDRVMTHKSSTVLELTSCTIAILSVICDVEFRYQASHARGAGCWVAIQRQRLQPADLPLA